MRNRKDSRYPTYQEMMLDIELSRREKERNSSCVIKRDPLVLNHGGELRQKFLSNVVDDDPSTLRNVK